MFPTETEYPTTQGKNVGQTLILSIRNGFDHEKWAFHSKVEPQVNVSFPKQSVKSY